MIPIATTTISVLRLPDDTPGVGEDYRDPYDPQLEREVIASGIRAHISSPGGFERVAGASQEAMQYRLGCDPTDLLHTDQVRDDTTGVIYDVVWVADRRGFRIRHVEAGLKTVDGVA